MIVTDMLGDAGQYENITPGDVVTGITASLLNASIHGSTQQAIGALITCEDQTVHFTIDGTAPTAIAGTNVGHALAAGDSYVIRGISNLRNFKCIDAVSASAGTVKVTVFF
jgi:hypothetical protein